MTSNVVETNTRVYWRKMIGYSGALRKTLKGVLVKGTSGSSRGIARVEILGV